jgi:hypothetical protein
MRHQIRNRKVRAGFGVLESTVAVGLFTVLIVAVLSFLESYQKTTLRSVELGEENDLRNYLRRRLDCDATVQRERALCTSTGGPIQGYDANNAAVVADAAAGMTFAHRLNFKLKCREDDVAYTISATVTRNGRSKELFDVPITCQKQQQPQQPQQPQPQPQGCPPIGTTDPFTLTGGPHFIKHVVHDAARRCGEPIPMVEFRRSTGGSGSRKTWTNLGSDDRQTLTKICNLIGYNNYVRSNCYDMERSRRYPSGKCNWHSPGDNKLQYFNGTNWVVQRNPPKYGWTWVSSITCSGRR